MADVTALKQAVQDRLANRLLSTKLACGELTLTIAKSMLPEVAFILRDESPFEFKMLVDLCGIDYQQYGIAEWATESTTATGFERGVDAHALTTVHASGKPRFAVVYHLLSLSHNQRLRLNVPVAEEALLVSSVLEVWPAAQWYEREVFDLFGIIFEGHPDLRRILTDYGFVGHPFRKDFPLSGKVEARYDAHAKRVIYEPVSIEPRVLEPKVIRHDNRYRDEG